MKINKRNKSTKIIMKSKIMQSRENKQKRNNKQRKKIKNQNKKRKVLEMPEYAKPHPDWSTIFVGGLCFEVTEEEIIEYFVQFGAVKLAKVKHRINKDGTQGKPLGHGVVVVENNAYFDILNSEEHFLKNHKIDCKEFFWGPGRNVVNNDIKKRTFEIFNMPKDATAIDLSAVFSEYGMIYNLNCLKDWDTKVKGPKARVIFEKEKVAKRVNMLAKIGEIKVKGFALKMKLKSDTSVAEIEEYNGSCVGSSCSIIERDIKEISKQAQIVNDVIKVENYAFNTKDFHRFSTREDTNQNSMSSFLSLSKQDRKNFSIGSSFGDLEDIIPKKQEFSLFSSNKTIKKNGNKAHNSSPQNRLQMATPKKEGNFFPFKNLKSSQRENGRFLQF